jgi:hypothetical protein
MRSYPADQVTPFQRMISVWLASEGAKQPGVHV